MNPTHEETTGVGQINTKGVSRKSISEVIKAFGINPSKKGYRYLCDAVEIVIEHQEYLDSITKSLYPAIKRLRKTKNWGSVERAMRHAIRTAESQWKENHQHMSKEVRNILEDVFPLGGVVHYCNKDFIANIAEYFLLQI